jgi:hypothetical protein
MQIFGHDKRVHVILLYSAYSRHLLSGFMQFGIDVVAQYVRDKRVQSDATTLYYGLKFAYAFSQVLFAVLALFAIRQGLTRWVNGPVSRLALWRLVCGWSSA